LFELQDQQFHWIGELWLPADPLHQKKESNFTSLMSICKLYWEDGCPSIEQNIWSLNEVGEKQASYSVASFNNTSLFGRTSGENRAKSPPKIRRLFIGNVSDMSQNPQDETIRLIQLPSGMIKVRHFWNVNEVMCQLTHWINHFNEIHWKSLIFSFDEKTRIIISWTNLTSSKTGNILNWFSQIHSSYL
jgi:hypothetical protein